MTVIFYSRLFEQELTSLNKNHIPLNALESIFLSRVEGRGYHVEGNNFFNFFLEKWKTNKKNLKNKWRVDISIHIIKNVVKQV